jgi:diaminohydroxyphosphoribosylaminopyrimidine deaminase / 5-amino-6-(5-phosphoribosylamino)uracil reductase
LKWTEADQFYMSRALQLARRGLFTTHPNPRVGCVIVRNNGIVAEGWHEYSGGPHAEINALNNAGISARGADCYVTLEPCVHIGKTPPCTDALISAGVKRVIIANIDPNPAVKGKGIEQLLQAGVTVAAGLLEQQAQDLNRGFFLRMNSTRPYIRCKLAMSVDGRTAMADGTSQWITGNEARQDVQRYRAQSAAILTGIDTILIDNPGLNLRNIDSGSRQPLRVILDRKLRIPKDAKILALPGETIIFTVYGCPDREKALVNDGIQVIRIDGSGEKDFLINVMHFLAKEQQINEVLVECGATLAGSLLSAGLLDELILYVAPVIFGNQARPLFNLPGLDSIDDKFQFEFYDIRMIGKDCRITLKPVVAD